MAQQAHLDGWSISFYFPRSASRRTRAAKDFELAIDEIQDTAFRCLCLGVIRPFQGVVIGKTLIRHLYQQQHLGRVRMTFFKVKPSTAVTGRVASSERLLPLLTCAPPSVADIVTNCPFLSRRRESSHRAARYSRRPAQMYCHADRSARACLGGNQGESAVPDRHPPD